MNKVTRETFNRIRRYQNPDRCFIEISKDDKHVIRIQKHNKLIYIGSKYNVQYDIDKFMKELGEFNDETSFIIFGLGAGEQIIELLNIAKNNKIIIIEPNSSLIQMMENKLSKLWNNDNVILLFFDNELKTNLDSLLADHEFDNLITKFYANYNKLYEVEYTSTVNNLNKLQNKKKTEVRTISALSKELYGNFVYNMIQVDKVSIINSYKDIFKGKPAIIVSAGPSLEKNLKLLREAQDKFIIITGVRTLKLLHQEGILADYICVVDPQYFTHQMMKDFYDYSSTLVYMDSAQWKIVNCYSGRKILFANQGMNGYLNEILGCNVDYLLQGSSVAHSCMGLAVYMGCNPISFIGQDLAYTNEKFEAEGAHFKGIDDFKKELEQNKNLWNKSGNSIWVNDIYGHKVRTSHILNLFREEFEELIEMVPNIDFINATEGGAHIQGTNVKTLKEVIDKYGVKAIDKDISYIPQSAKINRHKVLDELRELLNKIKLLKEVCKEGIKYSNLMLKYYNDENNINYNKILLSLDKVDEQIRGILQIGCVSFIYAGALTRLLSNPAFIAKNSETDYEKNIRIITRGKRFYEEILSNTTEEITRWIEETILISSTDENVAKWLVRWRQS